MTPGGLLPTVCQGAASNCVGRVCDVRLWHLADMQTARMNVRFKGNNGHDADVMRCLLMTHSGPYGAPLLECARMSGLLL